jgi:hypothetical protein
VVHHRRRRGDADRAAALRQVEHRLLVHRPVEGHVLDGHAVLEEAAQRARVHDRAREQVRARPLALVEHGHGDLAHPLGRFGVLLQQLAEPDRACEAGGPGADDRDAHVDALVLGVSWGGDGLRRRPRRRVVGGLDAH